MKIYSREYLEAKVPTLNAHVVGDKAVNVLNRINDYLVFGREIDGMLAYDLGLVAARHESEYVRDLAYSLGLQITSRQP